MTLFVFLCLFLSAYFLFEGGRIITEALRSPLFSGHEQAREVAFGSVIVLIASVVFLALISLLVFT